MTARPIQSKGVSAETLGRAFASARGELWAIRDVSFVAPPAALTVVEGPSGCGKTTLLNILGLLDNPSAGTLTVNGVATSSRKVSELSRLRRDCIGFLFQDAGLIDHMTAAQNICLPLTYRGVDRAERRARAVSALEGVGLGAVAEEHVQYLSGGERQRVAFARASTLGASILICDEPTASLDARSADTIAELLKAYARRGATVICSSHDPRLQDVADAVLSLKAGIVVDQASR